MKLDDSGLSRAAKRAALMEMQHGLCALCGSGGELQADHDHKTGLLRGLLCRRCNRREGQFMSGLYRITDLALEAYLASPPAAGLGWMWKAPDPPRPSIEDAITELLALGPEPQPPSARPPVAKRRSWRSLDEEVQAMTDEEMLEALAAVDLPAVGG